MPLDARRLLQRIMGARPEPPVKPEPPSTPPALPGASVGRSAVVDNAIYAKGRRVATPQSIDGTSTELRRHPGGMAWIGMYRPGKAELDSLTRQFGLHALAVEDAIAAHQRPKIEQYDESTFLVLRAARYIDETETVEFGELHIFAGSDYVITLRHAESPDLSVVRSRLEAAPELLALGPEGVIYAVLDAIVDGYAPVVAGLENDIDEIESEVFDGDPRVSRRIYQLSREVIDFQLAARPLAQILEKVKARDADAGHPELAAYLRDVADHVILVNDRVEEFRTVLRDILTVNATLVAQRQNDEMQRVGVAANRQAEEARKISAWAAILFVPSLIGSIYGMNFENMPELDWRYGYPFALGLMAALSGVLYGVFRKNDWL